MAMAMEPMLAAQLGKLGLALCFLEAPNAVVECLTFLRPCHYKKVFLNRDCKDCKSG